MPVSDAVDGEATGAFAALALAADGRCLDCRAAAVGEWSDADVLDTNGVTCVKFFEEVLRCEPFHIVVDLHYKYRDACAEHGRRMWHVVGRRLEHGTVAGKERARGRRRRGQPPRPQDAWEVHLAGGHRAHGQGGQGVVQGGLGGHDEDDGGGVGLGRLKPQRDGCGTVGDDKDRVVQRQGLKCIGDLRRERGPRGGAGAGDVQCEE